MVHFFGSPVLGAACDLNLRGKPNPVLKPHRQFQRRAAANIASLTAISIG